MHGPRVPSARRELQHAARAHVSEGAYGNRTCDNDATRPLASFMRGRATMVDDFRMSFPVIVGGAAAKISSEDELRRCYGPVAFGSCHVYAAPEL
jgi:hypothetical protein